MSNRLQGGDRVRCMKAFFGLLPAALVLLMAGCSGDDVEEPLSTATVGPAGSPVVSPFVPPTVTAEPGVTRIESTVQLINVRSGDAKILYEDFDDFAFYASFYRGEVAVGSQSPAGPVITWFALDGTELRQDAFEQPGQPSCNDMGVGGVEVDGRLYGSAGCGPVSPDGLWMTFSRTTGEVQLPGGGLVPVLEQWALNLQTEEVRLLQDGLRHCGGCDGRFGPEWSPSGRYLYFAEFLGNGRTFLCDLENGTTEVIFEGDTQINSRPDWSPAGDYLLHPAPGGATTLRDLGAGTESILEGISWPARFDETGTLIYSPAQGSLRENGGMTVVMDVNLRAVMASIPGQPPFTNMLLNYQPVARTGDSVVAAVERAAGCDGVAVYVDAAPGQCIEGAQGASVSPDGRLISAARRVGTTGPYSFQGGSGVDADVFDVIVVDVGSGTKRTVASSAVGFQYPLPSIWDSSTYLLVRTPYIYGP